MDTCMELIDLKGIVENINPLIAQTLSYPSYPTDLTNFLTKRSISKRSRAVFIFKNSCWADRCDTHSTGEIASHSQTSAANLEKALAWLPATRDNNITVLEL